ncbi:tripartite tricarboxylate transporter TctB family protein [Natronococcus sp. A-GB7]|uniref:tripartite tricarboxylate transporter TctB family protein n=1 Tax=Natronococcus sp. A-GB7 TaxID=3037649 RepID=UPI00241E0CC7|nr:tripartite tricarboxylate transporter TctB family protein [Natronococcus sp. A-GB7]MDG5820694.1 tripartite tricarboxylate transporter TctB family protein [Natronococcus sp. A-GB7]
MLVTFLVVSAVFIIEPVIESYPDDARVFPQLTAAAVFIGSLLLLLQNYLPGPVRRFVAESVSITSSEDSEVVDQTETDQEQLEDTEPEAEEYKKDTLGAKYGFEVDETIFMVSTAVLYFVAGWAAGFLFVTPLYIAGYTLWFRVNPVVSVGLAVAGTAVIYLFMTYLVLPFDQGHLFDFSPLVPMLFDGAPILLRGGL